MKTQMVLVMLAVLLPAGIPASEKPTQAYSEREPLPVDAASRITLSARLGLEMRRAEGPRRGVVENLLRDLGRVEPPSGWCTQVVETCSAGGADWAVFLPSVEALTAKAEPASRDYIIGKAELMRREAYLQALSMEQRQTLYREAIVTGHSITDLGPWLAPAECALRALREGMDELIPDIERGLNGPLRSNRESIQAALRMRKALMTLDPEEALLKLIRNGVEVEAEQTLIPVDKRRSDRRPFEADVVFAIGAVTELRRLNPPGAAERLAALYALYKPAEEKLDRDRDELLAKEKAGTLPGVHPRQEVSPATGLPGRLARLIVETIGDLGDREFERTVFKQRLNGLPTLWDRVNRVETELVRQGKMKASEMVTSEQ